MSSKTVSTEAKRFLNFSLAEEEFAVPLLSVREVIAIPETTPIPFTPAHFLGIMNLRGQVISVIDLRLKFGFKGNPLATTEKAVIICDINGLAIGVVVDSVNHVLSVQEKDIQPRPEIQSSKASDYILGVTEKDKRLILLLDIAKALDVADYQAIKNANSQQKAA